MEIWQTSSVVKYISLQFTTLLCEITNTEFGLWAAGKGLCLLALLRRQLPNRAAGRLIVFAFTLPAKGDNVAAILCLHISRFCI